MNSLYEEHMKIAADIEKLVYLLDSDKWTSLSSTEDIECTELFYLINYSSGRRYLKSNKEVVVCGEINFTPLPTHEDNSLWYIPGIDYFTRNGAKVHVPDDITEETHFQLSLVDDISDLKGKTIFQYLNTLDLTNKNLRIETDLVLPALQYYEDVCLKR